MIETNADWQLRHLDQDVPVEIHVTDLRHADRFLPGRYLARVNAEHALELAKVWAQTLCDRPSHIIYPPRADYLFELPPDQALKRLGGFQVMRPQMASLMPIAVFIVQVRLISNEDNI